ncbi:MAG: hypothetical protein EFT35_08035 [Methanophagales archaeon ANME-1-THS]|nr:MAG: hypothetical protein EFT35_08035 [Methanophagales archaeon ANME-1-THS]
MKWLDKIRSKDEIPSTVPFDGLDNWLGSVSQSLFRGLSTKADQIYREIRDTRERLKQNAARLQDAEPDETMPDHILKIGLLNRDRIVKHLYSVTDKIAIPSQTDYKTVLSFYRGMIATLDFPFGKSSKNIYCVRSLFPDEINELILDLNRLRTALNQLITLIKGKESQVMHLEHVPEIVQALKNLSSGIEKEKEKIYYQEEISAALEKKIEGEEERLRTIEASDEWIQFKELKIELGSLEEAVTMLESNVSKLFFPVKNALNLLKKQDETGRHSLTPEVRGAISAILASPIQALGEDIHKSLLAIRTTLEGDPSILKDRKREKTLKWIEYLLNADLPHLKTERDQLHSRIEEINGMLLDLQILNDRMGIEQSIASAKGQLIHVQEEIARSKNHIVSLEQERREQEKLLSGALEGIAGKKIEVTFNFGTEATRSPSHPSDEKRGTLG